MWLGAKSVCAVSACERVLIRSTHICCSCARQAYLLSLIKPNASPTVLYKIQVNKHKGLPWPHK